MMCPMLPYSCPQIQCEITVDAPKRKKQKGKATALIRIIPEQGFWRRGEEKCCKMVETPTEMVEKLREMVGKSQKFMSCIQEFEEHLAENHELLQNNGKSSGES